MNIKKMLDRLFANKSNSNYNVPVHSELIDRSTKEKFNFANGIADGEHLPYLKLLRDNYELRRENTPGTLDFQIFTSRASNGFYFGNHSVFKEKSFQMMFDYFKDRVEQMGYICKNNQRKFRETGDKIKLTEMYYLKPPRPAKPEGKMDQMYGNVHLELVSFDEVPEYIKCMVNVYSDNLFKEPRPFDEFMEKLLTEDQP